MAVGRYAGLLAAGCSAICHPLPIESRLLEVARFTDELLRVPSEAQARHYLGRARSFKRPIDFLGAVARLCRERGRVDAAVVVWRNVLELNPNHTEAHENLGKLLLLAKRQAEAVPHLIIWATRDPESSSAHALLGTALILLERWQEAEGALARSLQLNPSQPEVLTACATALWRQGRVPEAIGRLEELLKLRPSQPATLNDIGVMLLQTGRYQEAARAFTDAVQASPETAMIRHNLAIALRQSGRAKEALPHAIRALELGNPTPAMLGNLAMIHNDSEQFEEALEVLRNVDIYADHHTLAAHVIALRGAKRHDEAVAESRQSLESDPARPDLWALLGNILAEQGNGPDAEAAFDRALALRPHVGASHRAKSDFRRYSEGDPHLAQMQAIVASGSLSAEDKMHLDFALGKAYDDLGDFKRAFEHLRAGNQAKRAITPYDEDGVERLVQLVESILPDTIVPVEPNAITASELPVFVVGMPRSGTTLVEQILARHPAAVALGETKAFHRALDEKIFFAPEGVSEVADDRYRALAESYLEAIRSEAGDAVRAIDKLPSNFFFAGFAAKAMPNARIIHLRRDPVDTCISLYSKLFTHTQNFSYDLGELGRYYRKYRRVTDHWRTVIAEAQFLEVRYEALVEHPEQEVRRMLAFIGLPWDDACLDTHRRSGPVLTASMVQVRRPIYQTSVGRREGYLPYLGELIQALGPDVDG